MGQESDKTISMSCRQQYRKRFFYSFINHQQNQFFNTHAINVVKRLYVYKYIIYQSSKPGGNLYFRKKIKNKIRNN